MRWMLGWVIGWAAWMPVQGAEPPDLASGDKAEIYARQTISSIFDSPDARRAPMLLLGTFHFKDAGLDGYKPRFDVDILSPQRQSEIEHLIDRLARFKPTRIAVERRQERQSELDRDYQSYLAGGIELSSNEIHQIGFRLARRLGLPRVHAVDAQGAALPATVGVDEYARQAGLESLLNDPLDGRYEQLYQSDDALKTRVPLASFLLYLNSDARLTVGHGHYLIGGFEVGSGEAYPGPDGFVSRWYNRNLRIFHNLMRLTRDGDQRVLFIVGAGHVPILREQARSSPKIDLHEVADYLGE